MLRIVFVSSIVFFENITNSISIIFLYRNLFTRKHIFIDMFVSNNNRNKKDISKIKNDKFEIDFFLKRVLRISFIYLFVIIIILVELDEFGIDNKIFSFSFDIHRIWLRYDEQWNDMFFDVYNSFFNNFSSFDRGLSNNRNDNRNVECDRKNFKL